MSGADTAADARGGRSDEKLASLRREVEALRAAVAELRTARAPREQGEQREHGDRPRFAEIDVERVNVVEPDGTVRLALSKQARFPAPVVEGRQGQRSGRPLAGVIFYNDDGDECGGLYGYGRTEQDGSWSAGGGLNIDQYRPSEQVVGINYHGRDGRNTAGVRVWERVHGAQVQFPDQESIDASMIGRPYATRFFAGRTSDGAAVVRLSDVRGKLRLRLAVEASGEPTLDFFDERGTVIRRLAGAPDAHDSGEQRDPKTMQG